VKASGAPKGRSDFLKYPATQGRPTDIQRRILTPTPDTAHSKLARRSPTVPGAQLRWDSTDILVGTSMALRNDMLSQPDVVSRSTRPEIPPWGSQERQQGVKDVDVPRYRLPTVARQMNQIEIPTQADDIEATSGTYT
jgi:hypothetical protein